MLDEEQEMVLRLSDSSLDQVQIRLLLGNLQLSHSSIDLVPRNPKLFSEDREVQQAHQHEQQRPHETKHADQWFDSHSLSPSGLVFRLSRMISENITGWFLDRLRDYNARHFRSSI
jgi:hypothetical protein